MAGYLVLAENVILKNNRVSCINIYEALQTIAMPAEFRFDMAIMCGPKWSVGEHKLTLKVKANDGEEKLLSESTVNIPHEDFVYSAVANDVKFTMNYDVQFLTFVVYDNDKEVISRKYPVTAMLIPQSIAQGQEAPQAAAKPAEKPVA
jgi:hypothetical protein